MAFDQARSAAAESMAGPEPEADPLAGLDMGAPAGGDIEGAIAGLESALASLPPEAQEEIRAHVEAIREIASRSAEAPPPEAAGMPGLPGGEGAMPPGMPPEVPLG